MRVVITFSISILSLVFFSEVFAAAPTSDLRCFADKASQKTKLEMKVFFDETSNWSGGYVKYGKNKPPISIVLQSTKTIDENEGRPSTFQTVWLEIGANEVTGKYTTVTQGAKYYSLEYTGRKSNKTYKFDESTIRDDTNQSCKW